jgi:thioredoxin reductase
MSGAQLPVAVIGAGPVGLAAAAHLVDRGETPLVLEAGEVVGAHVLQWGHVRVFSPWRSNVDPVAASMLAADGWTPPHPADLPTGRELVERYLRPLAELPHVRPHIRLGARVLSITRRGFDKMKTEGRDEAPFSVLVRTATGEEYEVVAKAVIDASGTYGSPNPLGASGVPAVGERALANRVFYGIPDVLGADRARYAGRRVMVVGSGHSAFNTLLDLAELSEEVPRTRITWVVRRPGVGQLFGGEDRDKLPARGSLGARLRALVERETVDLRTGFALSGLRSTADGIVAESGDRSLEPVDEIVATTGYRPDLEILRELRLGLDTALDSPTALAPLIDPNVHSCGTVPPHGEAELRHPEPGFYMVGMKSYGRAPTFLMLTGYEQVRSVVAAIAGDWESARSVELVLPETGVCSTDVGVPVAVGAGAGVATKQAVCCG